MLDNSKIISYFNYILLLYIIYSRSKAAWIVSSPPMTPSWISGRGWMEPFTLSFVF